VRRSIAAVAGVLLALVIASPAAAVPTSGQTHIVGTPTSGQTFDVLASVHSVTPVVPYEYAIQNECSVPGKPGSTIQNDDIVYWTSISTDGDPQATMPIHLESVPQNATCKVFIVRNNTVVKGSTTSYTVA